MQRTTAHRVRSSSAEMSLARVLVLSGAVGLVSLVATILVLCLVVIVAVALIDDPVRLGRIGDLGEPLAGEGKFSVVLLVVLLAAPVMIALSSSVLIKYLLPRSERVWGWFYPGLILGVGAIITAPTLLKLL